jgi:hypothetical protein
VVGHVGVYQSTQWNAPAQLDNLIKTQALSQELRYTTQGEREEGGKRDEKRKRQILNTIKASNGDLSFIWN